MNADLAGPMEKDSVGGSRSKLVLKEDYINFYQVSFLKVKSEILNCMDTFFNKAKTATDTVKQIHYGFGKEFDNHSVKKISMTATRYKTLIQI